MTSDPGERGRAHEAPLEGRYANYFKVGFNALEFVVDLGQFYPEAGTARFHTRIVTSPGYAKALLATLRESMDRYEESFGVVEEG